MISIEWVRSMDFCLKTMIILVWVIRCKYCILKEALCGAILLHFTATLGFNAKEIPMNCADITT